MLLKMLLVYDVVHVFFFVFFLCVCVFFVVTHIYIYIYICFCVLAFEHVCVYCFYLSFYLSSIVI